MSRELLKTVFSCPHCGAYCQFQPAVKKYIECKVSPNLWYATWLCTNCHGMMMAMKAKDYYDEIKFFPTIRIKPTIDLSCLPPDLLADVKEALLDFSHNCYLSATIMCRRIIQSSCIEKGAVGNNLYEQIENMPIDESLKKLAHKIRFWGNNGAHPDILLGESPTEKEARLAVEFTEKFLEFIYVIPAQLDALDKKVSDDTNTAEGQGE